MSRNEPPDRTDRVDIDLTSAGLEQTLRTAVRPVVEPPPTLRLRCCPEGIRDWAVFQPNAPGRSELRGADALMVRQLMKGRREYIAERVLVVVGVRSVAMWHLLPGGIAGRVAGWWQVGGLVARPVVAVGVGAAPWPAATFVDTAAQRVVAELRGVRCDEHSYRVLSALAVH